MAFSVPTRVDNIQTMSVNVAYTPLRNVAVNASLAQGARHSNRTFSNYSATTFTVSGQLTF